MNASRLAATLLLTASVAGLPLGATDANAQSIPSYAAADARFMQGMIYHHAQALQMCALPASHGASQRVVLLCKKITISQRDEIAFMQQWLEDRRLSVPHPPTDTLVLHGSSAMAAMPGMPEQQLMPGMLTPEQMRALDQARDSAFDRLFLSGMIQHHGGAIRMVADLFGTPGAGQGADIFGYATGVDADQRAEIDRMTQMLNTPKGSNQT